MRLRQIALNCTCSRSLRTLFLICAASRWPGSWTRAARLAFSASATVTTETSEDHLAALLADTAGLRVTGDGMRSGWLTLPPTRGESGFPAAVVDEIARLVAATATLRQALKGRVAFSVAIFTARGTTRILPPRGSLPSPLPSKPPAGRWRPRLAEQFIALEP